MAVINEVKPNKFGTPINKGSPAIINVSMTLMTSNALRTVTIEDCEEDVSDCEFLDPYARDPSLSPLENSDV